MADNQAPAGSQGQNRGGGRRRARGGGAGQPGHVEQQQSTGGSGRGSRGKARGARGGGGGGGGGGGREKQQQKNRGGNVNGSSAGAGAEVQEAEKEKKEGPAEGATDDADDGEVCFICASNVEHTSVSPCNHRTCHICALRLRALYKNKGCAHCRVSRVWSRFDGGLRGLMVNRRKPSMWCLRTTRIRTLRSLRRWTFLARTTTWAFSTKKTKFSRIQSCCCGTIVPIGRAMWLAWDGRTCTGM